MRVAVIDLGTNTFNLIIAEAEGQQIRTLYNEKISVKLGKGGIGRNIILPDAFDRGLTALNAHNQVISNFHAEKVIALGTSALRTAENADDFIRTVKEKLNINVEIISGIREASLIYHGVLQTLENQESNFLILDIGGGSNEFIIANKTEMLWKESYKLGMARLIDKFKPSDPVKVEEISEMEKYFDKELKSLFNEIDKLKVGGLVGAEGAFASLFNMVQYNETPNFHPQNGSKSKKLDISGLLRLHEKLIRSTSLERMKMKGLEPYRVDMIIPATIFINYIIRQLNIDSVQVSPYSMKEGAAWEVLFNK
jgi:exopolyphosphatase/guanosine-5'-triphosphate,3'-diphosphate pyrophosphatase